MEMHQAEECYCHMSKKDEVLVCSVCKRSFHTGCLQSGRPSVLKGDNFFTLTCSHCSDNGKETCERIKLQWIHVVLLALYNLQFDGGGKCGYFRWKEHICCFINKHWATFFGNDKKKTLLWYGTVAGVLSNGCPEVFTSGVSELHEPGWWKLTNFKPPSLDTNASSRYKKVKVDEAAVNVGKMGGLRCRRGKTSIQSAIDLKARRSTLTEAKDLRKSLVKTSTSSAKSRGSLVYDDDYISNLPSTSQAAIRSSPPQTAVDKPTLSKDVTGDTIPMTKVTGSCVVQNTKRGLVNDTDGLFSPVSTNMFLTSNRGKDVYESSSVLRESPNASLSNTASPETIETFGGEHQLSGHRFSQGPYRLEEESSKITENKETFMECNIDNRRDDSKMISIKREDGYGSDDSMSKLLTGTIDSDMDFDIDPVMLSPPSELLSVAPSSPSLQDMLDSIRSSRQSSIDGDIQSIDEGGQSMHAGSEVSGSELRDSSAGEVSSGNEEAQPDKDGGKIKSKKKRGRRRREEGEIMKPQQKYSCISLYDEQKLLEMLNDLADMLKPEMRRLRRKLIVRQEKRQNNMRLFNLDKIVNDALGAREVSTEFYNQPVHTPVHAPVPYNIPVSHGRVTDQRILDRYQVKNVGKREERVPFRIRLVGREDHELQPLRSPHTTRLLKPYIRRDIESRPIKLRLRDEIIAYPHRCDPHWQSPPPAPIDYCYVRPEHIPSVNSLCHEFFWPGIDLSECLHYPDFSCVVLYRKIVIAFAFMVPDLAEARHNEAYISFIFTHPEWRRAGIATFMVYHLIQTCMGKDLTLHVAADNPAMVLYQKFGFKPEEYIHGFYDKYSPATSKLSTNAFFLRLRR